MGTCHWYYLLGIILVVHLQVGEAIPVNVARGRPTKQSATANNGVSSRAVDGVKNPDYEKASCTHTGKVDKPWWLVDLMDNYTVTSVEITNRASPYGSRLKKFNIRVGNHDTLDSRNSICYSHDDQVGDGETVTIECVHPLIGQYVSIDLYDAGVLTLCEVEVYSSSKSRKLKTVNLARGKPTIQSSTYETGYSSNAVDGVYHPDYYVSSCTHTNDDEEPWWRVDLMAQYTVTSVNITNRVKSYGRRLKNFDIRVGNHDEPGRKNSLCRFHGDQVEEGKTVNLNCAHPIPGQYVYIRLRYKERLTLCEVEVYASLKSTIPVNVAKGRLTQQSATKHGGVSSRAVDGVRNPHYDKASCTHTGKVDEPWWRVDLMDNYKVSSVKITNRADHYGYRLKHFSVRVGKIDEGYVIFSLCGLRHENSVEDGETVTFNCDPPIIGQFVEVGLQYYEALTLCEVEIYSSTDPASLDIVNVARGKPTTQSSTSHNGISSRAVDGIYHPAYYAHSCTHTNKDAEPWWRVDLMNGYTVIGVNITNRADPEYAHRLKNFYVRVGDKDAPGIENLLCRSQLQEVGRGETVNIKCTNPLFGQYVFIGLMYSEILTLCEVEVISSSKPADMANVNFARGRPTKQSSTAHSGASSRAVDGNLSPEWRDSSCTHTKEEKSPWWRVDLRSSLVIGRVKVTNRADCCSERLSNFDVYIGDIDAPLGNLLCYNFNARVASGKTEIITCDSPLVGRYVYIKLRNHGILTLCEVEVYSPTMPSIKGLTCNSGMEIDMIPKPKEEFRRRKSWGRNPQGRAEQFAFLFLYEAFKLINLFADPRTIVPDHTGYVNPSALTNNNYNRGYAGLFGSNGYIMRCLQQQQTLISQDDTVRGQLVSAAYNFMESASIRYGQFQGDPGHARMLDGMINLAWEMARFLQQLSTNQQEQDHLQHIINRMDHIWQCFTGKK